MIEKPNKLRKKRRSLLFLLTFVLAASMVIGTGAQGVVTENTSIDAETVVFSIGEKSYQKGLQAIETDAAPYIKDIGGGLGRTMVPVSFVAPALGSEPAQWFPAERKVLITKGEKDIEIFIGSTEMLVNGKVLQMDTAAEVVNVGNGGGRTMLPIAFIARALDVGYEWLGETKEVYFYGKNLIFDNSVNYGPDIGTETIEGNVIVKAPGVILNDLYIKGNLIIAEEVGDGDVTLNNITVKGQTYIRGGGKDSIYINSGQYNSIIIQKIGGEVRVVAKDADGLIVVLARDVAGERIFLEGNFASVTVEAENAAINLTSATSIEKMVLEEKAVITGSGTIIKAEVKADGVVFEKMPQESEVTGTVTIPPALPPSTPSGGDGGGGDSGSNNPPQQPAELGGTVTISGTAKFGETLTANIGELTYTPDTSSDVPSYQWKRGGTAIAGATNNSYTLAEADIGQAITVTVSADGTNATGSVTSGATAAVAKADGPAAPAAPTVDYKTHNSVTLAANADNEFSSDGGSTWGNNIFEGLLPGTPYTFVARVKETATHLPSEASGGTTLSAEPTPLVLRRLNALSSLPSSSANDVAFSHNGQYMAVAFTGLHGDPNLVIYKRQGDTFVELSLAEPPSGYGYGITFSPCDNYLAVAHKTSPYITIYKRDGDTFTKLNNPDVLPPAGTNEATDVAFNHNSQYLAVSHWGSPYITIYERSGDSFTKLADPDVLPAGTCNSVDFNHNSQYLAVSHLNTPYVTVYKRNPDDTFTKLDNPETLPSGSAFGIDFIPTSDDQYLAVAHGSSPYLTVYKQDGDTFTKVANPDDLPPSTGWSIAFNHDGKYLGVGHSWSPFAALFVRYGDTFIKLDNMPDLGEGAQSQGVAFSPVGDYFAVAYNGLSQSLALCKMLDPTATGTAITGTTTDITGAAIGSWDGEKITSVPAGTKVFALKGVISVSDNATVEILTGPGGTVVSDQTTTDVTDTMVVEVTAGNGTDNAEYDIVMAE